MGKSKQVSLSRTLVGVLLLVGTVAFSTSCREVTQAATPIPRQQSR